MGAKLTRLLLFLVVTACSAKSNLASVKPSTHDAEIYAITLESLLSSRAGDHKQRTYVLIDSTQSFRRESLVPDFWTDLLAVSTGDSGLVKAFEIAARTRHSLRPIAMDVRSRVSSSLQLVADSTLARVRAVADSSRRADTTYPRFAEGYWRAFYGVFPNSYGSTSVSAIGYTPDSTRALLFVSHSCGALCGEGNVVLLRLQFGRWRVEKTAMLWVS